MSLVCGGQTKIAPAIFRVELKNTSLCVSPSFVLISLLKLEFHVTG